MGGRDFFICLDLELFAKIKKDIFSTNSQKPDFLNFLLITQDLSKMNIPEHSSLDIVKRRISAKNVKLIGS